MVGQVKNESGDHGLGVCIFAPSGFGNQLRPSSSSHKYLCATPGLVVLEMRDGLRVSQHQISRMEAMH